MYPATSFSKKTDVDLLEMMQEIQEYFKKYKSIIQDTIPDDIRTPDMI